MPDVHDYHLIGYEVDGDAKRIVLHAEYRYPGTPLKKTDVVFDGVEAYSFRYDCGNIINNIEERPLDKAVGEHWAEFDAGYCQSGWPRFWRADQAKDRERVAAFVRDGVKWFELTSSIGMEGWVICRTVEYRIRTPTS
jgi:hypothetical protein